MIENRSKVITEMQQSQISNEPNERSDANMIVKANATGTKTNNIAIPPMSGVGAICLFLPTGMNIKFRAVQIRCASRHDPITVGTPADKSQA